MAHLRFRRVSLVLSLLGLIVLVFTAAGAARPTKTTLTWWDYFGYSPEADKATNGLIKAYEASHPDVQIKRTSIGFADFRTKAVQAAATGNFPDIAFIDQGDVPIFASQGVLADLTSYMQSWGDKGKYIKNVFAGCDQRRTTRHSSSVGHGAADSR